MKKADAIAVLGLAVAGALLFAPSLAGRAPLIRDFPGFTLPSRHLWQVAWSEGRVPEWNRFVGLGLPVLAAPVHGALYPGHLPLLFGRVAVILPALFAAHAVLAGLGGYLLARVHRAGAVAAFVGAMPWLAGGYAASMWQNGEKVLSGAWIPWAVACLLQSCRRGAHGAWTVASAISLALMALAGDPFLWLDTLALALPLAVALVWDEEECAAEGEAGARAPARPSMWGRGRLAPLGRHLAAVSGRVAVSVALAALLAAPALLPAWLLRGDTERSAALPGALADAWSLHPWRLLELVAPGAFGDPNDLTRYPGGRFADDPFVQALPWAVSIYTGAAAVLLPWLAGRRRMTMALVGAAALGLLAALGRHTPVYPLLRTVVFPLGWTRYPEKHVVIAVGALSLLGALGCERALRSEAKLRGPALLVVALPALALVVAPADLRATVMAGGAHFALAGASLLGALAVARRHASLGALVAAVVAFDLGAAALPLFTWVPAGDLDTPPPAAVAIARARHGPTARLHRPRGDHLRLDTLPENGPTLFGIGTYPGHDPAKSPRLAALAAALPWPRLEQLLRLDAVLVPVGGGGEWTLGMSSPGPRAWMVGHVRLVPDDATALATLAATDFDLEREAVVERGPDGPEGSGARARGLGTTPQGACTFACYEAERLDLTCDASDTALVVLSEAWAAGWTVTIDGAKAPLERADVALRGVVVPPGRHRATFLYATPGLRVGLGLGAFGVIGAGFVLVRAWKRRSGAGAGPHGA